MQADRQAEMAQAWAPRLMIRVTQALCVGCATFGWPCLQDQRISHVGDGVVHNLGEAEGALPRKLSQGARVYQPGCSAGSHGHHHNAPMIPCGSRAQNFCQLSLPPSWGGMRHPRPSCRPHLHNVLLVDGGKERGPPGARVKLGVTGEQGQATHCKAYVEGGSSKG